MQDLVAHLRHVDLNLLVVLHALLEESSVTRAAQRLGLSTPAVSHALARLRDTLDDQILVRAGRTMVPSRRAQELAPQVERTMRALTAIMAPVRTFELATLEREFRIHATDHVLSVIGGAIDALVAREAPGVTLSFLPNQPDDAQLLRADKIDLCVGVYTDLPPELELRALFDDRLVCVLGQNHPRAKRKRLSLEQYLALDHVLVSPRGRPGSHVDRLLEDLGKTRRVVRTVPYFLSALELVSRTDYVATLSERLAHAMRERFALTLVEPPFEPQRYTMQMLWHPRDHSDPAHVWLRSVLVRASQELAG